MADSAAETTPVVSEKKKAPKAKKVASAKKPSNHPKYSDMIAAAIKACKDRKGTSGQAIKKYIAANYKVDEKSVGPHVRVALKRGVATGALKQVKGAGAAGSFKLADKTEKPKKTVTKKEKKPAAEKKVAAKKPATKKKAAKKPAAKKAKSPKKAAKSPAKKPVAKKAKKPAAKKATAKK